VHLDYLCRGFHRRYRVLGTHGTIEADLATGSLRSSDATGQETRRAQVTSFERNEMYAALIREFLDEVTGTALASRLPSFVDSGRVLRLAFEAKRHTA